MLSRFRKRSRKIILIYYIVFIYLLLEEMEKLIELLNEYSELRDERVIGEEGQPIRKRKKEHLEYPIEKIRIISKSYGFIKWLVENDNIDFVKTIKNIKGFPFDANYRTRNKYECILMTLAIQDNPIEFLISILN